MLKKWTHDSSNVAQVRTCSTVLGKYSFPILHRENSLNFLKKFSNFVFVNYFREAECYTLEEIDIRNETETRIVDERNKHWAGTLSQISEAT